MEDCRSPYIILIPVRSVKISGSVGIILCIDSALVSFLIWAILENLSKVLMDTLEKRGI